MSAKRWGDGVYNLISWFDIEKVRKATVLVVGAGALGNEVLKNLALLGVGNIIIVDFDTIEYSNLTRSVLFRKSDAELQAYKSEIAARRIKELNPEINTYWLKGDIEKEVGLGYFKNSDVIIGCLDSMLARYVVNNYALRFRKPWVDGGIKNLDGHAGVHAIDKSCYACSLSDEAKQSMAIREGCADIFNENMSYGRIATTPISASIIGAIQAQEALKLIHGYQDGEKFENFQVCKTLLNKNFYYEGMNMDAYEITTDDYFDICPHHDTWENVISDHFITTEITIEQLFEYLEKKYQDKILALYLRNPFVTHLLIKPGDRKYELMVPDSKVGDFIIKNDIKIDFEETAYKLPSPEGGYNLIDQNFEWKHLTLEQVGIPKFDVLHIESQTKDYYIEMTQEKFK
jgi:adenylyltransferase/sulfurtransferase